MRKLGKRGKQWILDRQELLKRLPKEYKVQDGIVYGQCADCGNYTVLTMDHRRKRSLGGSNELKNISLVCMRCHIERDQMGDPMDKKKDAEKKNKSAWQKSHVCIHCKRNTMFLICDNCKKMSI